MLRSAPLVLLVLIFCAALPAAAQADPESVTPRTKDGGAPWRIAYYEGGAYKDYLPVLESIVAGLEKLGWVENTPEQCFAGMTENRPAWECLARETRSPYLEFVADAFWSADWDAEARVRNKSAATARLREAGDLDVVIAMGTWAGQDLATDEHAVPTVVCSTSNPLQSGIIASVEDSGRDHVHARVDPDRYARQVAFFHGIVGFKRLGLVHDDTPEGRSYAGLDQIEPLAGQLGFEIVSCQAPFSGVDEAASREAVLRCHQELAPKVDAFYITTHRGVVPDNITQLMQPFLEHKVPTFSMGVDFEVAHGALMSMARPEFYFAGGFYAAILAKIFNGAKPRDLPQVFLDPHNIYINIETARRIEFHPPVEVLSEASVIFETIQER